MRHIAAFLAGVIAWALTLWAASDRSGKSLSVRPPRVESRVTVYVKGDPTRAIPRGDVAQFLTDIGLSDDEKTRILEGAKANFISQLSIEYLEELPGRGSKSKGIWFDVVDGKFSKNVGTYGHASAPRQGSEDSFRFDVPR